MSRPETGDGRVHLGFAGALLGALARMLDALLDLLKALLSLVDLDVSLLEPLILSGLQFGQIRLVEANWPLHLVLASGVGARGFPAGGLGRHL